MAGSAHRITLSGRLGRGLLMLVFAAVSIVGSALTQLQLPLTRRLAANSVTKLASGEITGALVVARFDSLAPGNIVARGLTLWDAHGNAIINADRLALTLEPMGLLAGRVSFKSARLSGATVHLVDGGDGLPTLLTTFDASRDSGPKSGKPLQIRVGGIQISNTTLYGDLLGLHGFRAVQLQARGELTIGPDVRARIDGATADLVEPFGYVAHFESLTGVISTRHGEGIQLLTSVQRDQEHASAQIRYAPPPSDLDAEDELDLKVFAGPLSADTLHGLGYAWVPDLALPIAGELHMHGPVERFELESDIHTDAGEVHAEGTIGEAEGVAVTLTTPGVELAQLLPDYPDVHATGIVKVALEPEEDHARLHLDVEPLSWGSLHLPHFTLDGVVLDDGLRIDRIDGRGRGSRLTGHGRIMQSGQISLDLHTSFDEIRSDPNFTRWARGAEGSLQANLKIERQQAGQTSLDFAGTIVVEDFHLGLLRAERLELRGSARGDPQRPRIALTVGGAGARLGEYMLGDPNLSLRGGPSQYHAEGQFIYAGRRTFNIDASVRADRNGFTADADPIEFTVGNGTWRGAMQHLRVVGNNSVELGLLRLASRSQRLEAHGQLAGDKGPGLEAELQNFDLAALRALVGDQLGLEQGHADARVKIAGSARDPDLFVQGALRDGVMGKIQNINALYLVKYKLGVLEANGEIDVGERGLLRIDGKGQLDRRLLNPLQALRQGSYEVELSADKLALDLLPALARQGIGGAVSGELRAHGTALRPELQGRLTLGGFAMPGATPLDIVVDGGFGDGHMRAKFNVGDSLGALGAADTDLRLDLRALVAEPSRALQIMMQGPWQISGYSVERRLDAMPSPLAAHVPYPAAVTTHFRFGKNGEFSQGELEFELDWQQAMRDGGCGQDARARGRGVLKLDQGTSRVEMKVFNGATRIADLDVTLDTPIERWAEHGAFELPRMLRARARAEVAAMQQVPYLCEYGDGRFNAKLELDGGLTSSPKLELSVDSEFLPRLQVTSRRRKTPARSCDDDPIKLHMQLQADREQLTGTAHSEGCNGGSSDLRGRLAVQWGDLLVLPAPMRHGAVQASLSLDGAELKPLLERIPDVIYAQGKARGELTLSGNVDQVVWGGQIAVESARLYLVSTGQELSDINSWLEFHGNWAKLEQQLSIGNGRLQMTGGIGFAGIMPNRARVAVRTKDLPIKREGVEIAALTGNTSIDATIQPDATRAKIHLDELLVRLPEESNRALQPLAPHQDVVVVSEAPNRLLDSYPIEFEVSASNKVSVQRDDFQARVEPALKVRYADPDLRVDGLMTFHGGEFEVFGKRFTVNTGSMRFDGGTELDPEIYLMAIQKAESTSASPVNVWVTGTLQKPEVTFSVDVCSGETAAINYLLSGQCGNDADDAFSQDTGNAPAAFAAGVIGGILTLGAQRELKGLAPRIAIQRSEGAQRVQAGFSSESLVPAPLRGLVKRIYIAGGVLSPDAQSANIEGGAPPENTALEFLIELYFPHNLVGSARAAPPDWAIDMLWEP